MTPLVRMPLMLGRFRLLPLLSYLAGSLHVISAQTTTQPSYFQGYDINGVPGQTSAVNCDTTETWSTYGTLAQCCAFGESCNFYTACNAGTMALIDGEIATCGTDLPNCGIITIYATYPFATQSWTQMNCVISTWSIFKLYREIPATTSSTHSSSATTATASSAISNPTKPAASPTASATTPPPTGTGAAAAAGATGETAQPSSQAWIAAAVVVPVVGVALVGFFAFWLGKRRANNKKLLGAASDKAASFHPGAGYHHNTSPSPAIASDVEARFLMNQDPAISSTSSPPIPAYRDTEAGSGMHHPSVQSVQGGYWGSPGQQTAELD